LVQNWNEIISGCRKGDQKSYLLAYRQVWKVIYPAVYRIVENRQQAEDILQESIVRGFDRLGELREPANYPAWQRTIAVREAFNVLRDQKRESLISLDGRHEILQDDEEADFPDVSHEAIMATIEKLAPGYRKVIQLHLIDGMTHEEIGISMGVGASTARSQYSRALGKLKNLLHEELQRSN
jgi:RNA polymerase sigma-70 factor (ECF subfamily)